MLNAIFCDMFDENALTILSKIGFYWLLTKEAH